MDRMHENCAAAMRRAVQRKMPSAEMTESGSRMGPSVVVHTATDQFQRLQSIASDAGMRFERKVGGNDDRGTASYLFVPKYD